MLGCHRCSPEQAATKHAWKAGEKLSACKPGRDDDEAPPTAGKKRPQPASAAEADDTPTIEEISADASEADELPPSEDTATRADTGRGAAGRAGRGGGRGGGRGSGFQRQ